MLNCHMDVVAEGDPESWEYPPFGGVVADGQLHGRGSMDIKGPLALQTYAAAALRGKAAGDVLVAHTVFEERGGWGMEYLLASGEVHPAVVIIGEATRGDITIGHRGRGELEVVLRGTAGHASAPERARNPLDLVPMVLRAIGHLAQAQGEDPLLGRASLVATGIEVSPESRNVIPDTAVVVVDWRVLPGSSNEDLVGQVREAVQRFMPEVPEGMEVEVRMARERQVSHTGQSEVRDLFTPGFLMEAEDPFVSAAARAVGTEIPRTRLGATVDLCHRRGVEPRRLRDSHDRFCAGRRALRPHEPGAPGTGGGRLGVPQLSRPHHGPARGGGLTRRRYPLRDPVGGNATGAEDRSPSAFP